MAVEYGASGGWFFALTVADAVPGWRYQYIVDGEGPYPDPASRQQTNDVHDRARLSIRNFIGRIRVARSALVVLGYLRTACRHLHSGRSFLGVISRLDHLCDLGVSAIELMPVADFPGERNWG